MRVTKEEPRKPGPIVIVGPAPATFEITEGLAAQVHALETKATLLEGLCGDLWATIKVNLERGHLVVPDPEGAKVFEAYLLKCSERLKAAKGGGR